MPEAGFSLGERGGLTRRLYIAKPQSPGRVDHAQKRA